MATENVPAKSVFGTNVGLANPEALMRALDNSAQKDPRGAAADGSDYASFSGKMGVYSIGQDKVDANPEELWAVNVSSFQDGWICWRGNTAVATRMYPLGTDVPQPDLNEHGPFTGDGDGWYQAKAMVLKSVDTGQQIYFKNNAVSGVSEIAKLQKAVIANLRAGQPYWPIVSLQKEKFTAKGRTNFKPIFKIDGWLSDAVMAELASALDAETEFDLDDFYQRSGAGGALSLDDVEGGDAELDEGVNSAEDLRQATKAAAPAAPPPSKPIARRNKRL